LDWKAHLILGVLAGAAVAHFAFGAGGERLLLFCAISGAAALLPDIDLRKSKVSQVAYAAAAAAVVAVAWLLSGGDWRKMLLYAGAAALGLLAFDLLARPRHRGITHSLAFMCAVAAAGYLAAGAPAAAAIASGYLSHLLADGALKVK